MRVGTENVCRRVGKRGMGFRGRVERLRKVIYYFHQERRGQNPEHIISKVKRSGMPIVPGLKANRLVLIISSQ